MKNYEDVKKVSEETIYGIAKTIRGVLDEEESDKLYMELAMILFTLTLDFSLPEEEFVEELNRVNVNFALNIIGHVMDVKEAVDKGEL